MINLIIPVAAVVFSFIIAILTDIKVYKRLVYSRFADHAVRTAIYLASIGMLEVLDRTEPDLAPFVGKVAVGFAFAELVSAIGLIRNALGPSDPGVQVLDSLAGKLQQTGTVQQDGQATQQRP